MLVATEHPSRFQFIRTKLEISIQPRLLWQMAIQYTLILVMSEYIVSVTLYLSTFILNLGRNVPMEGVESCTGILEQTDV